MTPEQKAQAMSLALQACQAQREAALNQVIDYQVDLTFARARIAELEAQIPKRKKAKTE